MDILIPKLERFKEDDEANKHIALRNENNNGTRNDGNVKREEQTVLLYKEEARGKDRI